MTPVAREASIVKMSTGGIELDAADARDVLRHRFDERFGAQLGEEQPQQSAESRKQRLSVSNCRMMRRRLAPIAARSAISSAGGGAREEKICHVGIRDQQHADDRAEEDVQRGAHIADHVFPQRLGADSKMGIRIRVLLFHGGGNGLQIRLRLRDGNPGFQPRD